MKSIKLSSILRQARNGEHYQAHADILNAISEAFVSGQGIKALRDAYAKLYELEDECYLRNQAYEDTPEIAEADQLRDELFLFVSQTIETNKLSPVAANREAAGRLGGSASSSTPTRTRRDSRWRKIPPRLRISGRLSRKNLMPRMLQLWDSTLHWLP